MSSNYSDPSWWPTPPLKPPKAVSIPKLVIGTLLPIIAVAVGVVLIITHHSSKPTTVTGRSVAAFTACVQAKLLAAAGLAVQPAELEAEAKACRSHLPAGQKLPGFAQAQQGLQPHNPREAYEQCLRLALSSSGSGGRFGADPQAVANATRLCRSITSGTSQTTTAAFPSR